MELQNKPALPSVCRQGTLEQWWTHTQSPTPIQYPEPLQISSDNRDAHVNDNDSGRNSDLVYKVPVNVKVRNVSGARTQDIIGRSCVVLCWFG